MALVLSRRENEAVVIGDNVRVIVNWASGGTCSLAFEAPPDVRIVREEIKDRDAERCEGAK